MAADPEEHETAIATREEALRRRAFSNGQESATGTEQETEEEEGEDDDDSDDEPKLKHKRLTENLNTVYRNGDSTSSFMLAGDKMVCCFNF